MQQYQYKREVRTIQYEVGFRTGVSQVGPPFICVDQGQRSCVTMNTSWEKIYYNAFSLHSSPFYIKRSNVSIMYAENLYLKPYDVN
jgi:hypothetical protein